MFSVKIFTIHSWEFISWKWTCLFEIWIRWFQKELAISQFQIPHTKSQNELWKPDLNLVSPGCQHEKIINFSPRIRTRDTCISCEYVDIGPSKPDKYITHKAVYVKIPVEQICPISKWPARMAVLGSSQWNYYWFVETFDIFLWWSIDKILST